MNLDRRAMEKALPGYEIGDERGRGAFGIVFSGRHRTLGRLVAIKQLPRAFGVDPAMRDRFISEARLVASLDHPHIVPVYDYVEYEGLRLIVMEHLSDGTLAEKSARPIGSPGAVTVQSACAVTIAVALGLNHAHTHGVLHRDVKPDNVLFSGETPKLADFGIAKSIEETQRLTVTGTVIGTVAYMSPEQASGETMGSTSDVYSCGVMLYELVAGRLPFPAVESLTGQLLQHLTATPEPLAAVAPSVPAGIADVVMATLAKSPKDRPNGAGELAVQLDAACRAAFGGRWLSRSGVRVVGLDDVVGALRPETVVAKRAESPAHNANQTLADEPDTIGLGMTTSAPETITTKAAPTTAPSAAIPDAAISSRPKKTVPRWPMLALGLILVAILGAALTMVFRGSDSAKTASGGASNSNPAGSTGSFVSSATAAGAAPTNASSTLAANGSLSARTVSPSTQTATPPTTLTPTTAAPTAPPAIAPPATAPPATTPPATTPPTPTPTTPPATTPPATTPPATTPIPAPTAAAAVTPPSESPTKAEAVRSAGLTAVENAALAHGWNAAQATCARRLAAALSLAELTRFVGAINGANPFDVKAKRIVKRCGPK